MEWISVKDRVPETNDVYLTFCPKRGRAVRRYYPETKFTIGQFNGSEPKLVTHWAFLPEPPKQ